MNMKCFSYIQTFNICSEYYIKTDQYFTGALERSCVVDTEDAAAENVNAIALWLVIIVAFDRDEERKIGRVRKSEGRECERK